MKDKLKYIITAAAGLIAAVGLMFSLGIVKASGVNEVMRILSDSFFVPGAVLCGIGLIAVVSKGGFFDIFGYGFISFVAIFKKDVKKRKYKDYVEYKQAKRESKFSVWFLLIVGLAFILVAVIFLVLFRLV